MKVQIDPVLYTVDNVFVTTISRGTDLRNDYWYGWEHGHCIAGPFRTRGRAEKWLSLVGQARPEKRIVLSEEELKSAQRRRRQMLKRMRAAYQEDE